MLKWVKKKKDLEKLRAAHGEYLVVLFWGSFSDAAQRALGELKRFGRDFKDVPLYAVDVGKLKGVHAAYGVESVPTVVVIRKGKETNRFEGAESAAFYATRLGGMAPAGMARPAKKKTPRVTVYTSPGCAPCGLVKNYLRENGIPFRAIDISRDERAAREIVRRSGRQAVPQIDINGRIVVGFDKAGISRLLGINTERSHSS